MQLLKTVNTLLALPLIACCRLWKLGPSKLLGERCRFHPSCSDYTAEALAKYGFFPGVVLATKRLLKCHPLNPGGVDYP